MTRICNLGVIVLLLSAFHTQSLTANEQTARRFTSESVCAGHPDKICDQVSDAILDAILAQDPKAKVGVETVVGANCIGLFGEVNTTADVDFALIASQTIQQLDYISPEWGFSYLSPVLVYIHKQSPEITLGVEDDQGAGDQGMMFGYACDETPEFMPLPIALAHALTRQLDEVRKNKTLDFIRPDGKSQVTISYENDRPVRVEKVVIATPHREEIDPAVVRESVIREVVNPVLSKYGFSVEPSQVLVNGTGLWHIPGPATDAGLTGRKIVVDTYGGYARIGGGAFSGKDPSKVDRSGAYAARYIAKNIVAAGLAKRCEVGLAYVIGQQRPVMQQIETFGTATISSEELDAFANRLIDTSVRGIINTLDLRRPIFQSTAAYGHFGRGEHYPWEKIASDR